MDGDESCAEIGSNDGSLWAGRRSQVDHSKQTVCRGKDEGPAAAAMGIEDGELVQGRGRGALMAAAGDKRTNTDVV